MLCAFRLMTQDFWENLYQLVSRIVVKNVFYVLFSIKHVFLFCVGAYVFLFLKVYSSQKIELAKTILAV